MMPPLPKRDHAPVLIREYGCVECQRYHREGIDPEYQSHLHAQSKHGTRERVATIDEIFLLEMGHDETI